jgi:hypothetical protein
MPGAPRAILDRRGKSCPTGIMKKITLDIKNESKTEAVIKALFPKHNFGQRYVIQ